MHQASQPRPALAESGTQPVQPPICTLCQGAWLTGVEVPGTKAGSRCKPCHQAVQQRAAPLPRGLLPPPPPVQGRLCWGQAACSYLHNSAPC